MRVTLGSAWDALGDPGAVDHTYITCLAEHGKLNYRFYVFGGPLERNSHVFYVSGRPWGAAHSEALRGWVGPLKTDFARGT